jgi:hypothetical protein
VQTSILLIPSLQFQTGLEFLEQAMNIFADAKRVLLTTYANTDAAIRLWMEILRQLLQRARYGKLLPGTGDLYFTTQAWAVLRKCWKGFKIAKGQDDFKSMRYYAEGIRRARKSLG